MDDVNGLRVSLLQILDQADKWLGDLASESATRDGQLPSLGGNIRAIGRLRTRAAPALINVALLGGFSSGKSFLLSGLQRGVELKRVSTADKYIGLLPAAPTPTTACPATVIPVEAGGQPDANGRGFLRVRFVDTEDWEDIGNSPAPPVVAAYAMEQADITARLEHHWTRDVAEIEILLSEVALPAKLYDLPGHGSPNAIHDQVVRRAMADADCFIYVANATRSLSENDLELIRHLYDHYTTSGGKWVVWVVTAIDRAMDLGLDDQPAWKSTVDRNNSYLQENFKLPDGRPDSGFIGRGFLAVSPALEARGRLLLKQGEDAEGRRLLAESRMDELREVLNRLIRTYTGKRHIAAIAAEARALVTPHYRVLADRLAVERLPIDQLTTPRAALGKRLDDLAAALEVTGSRLKAMLEQRIRTAEQPFDKLASHLHATLDEDIRSADLRKKKEENKVEVHKTQITREWMTTPTGPETIWKQEFESFTNDVLGIVRATLRDSNPVSKFDVPAAIDINQLIVPKSEPSRSETRDIVERAAAVISVITPVATAVGTVTATAMGATAGAVVGWPLLVPAGLTAAAAVVYGAAKHRKSRTTSLDVLREEWIADLDKVANDVRQWFVSLAGLRGSEIIVRAEEILAERRDELARQIVSIEDRMGQPETLDRQDLITRLEPLCKEGEELVASLVRLTHE